jgi:hypothetical protein
MRRLAPGLLAIAGLALLAIPSGAAPFTSHFDPLINEMVVRLGSIPDTGLTPDQRRQRSALNRSFKFEAVASKDLAGDLAMARKIVSALEKAFPGDGEFGGLFTGLNDGLAADVDAERDEAVVLISIAKAGAVRTRAEARLAAADALFIAADEALTQALRARSRERGYRAVVQAAALAVRAGPDGTTDASTMSAVVDGQPWASNTKFGTGVTGLGDVSSVNEGLRKIVVSGRRIQPLSTDGRLPGETSKIQITLTSANADIVPGIYTTGSSSGVNATASWYIEDENENVSQAVTTGGTIEITSLTVHAGSIDIAGTFSLTMYDGLADAMFDIGSGVFDAVGVPRNTLP